MTAPVFEDRPGPPCRKCGTRTTLRRITVPGTDLAYVVALESCSCWDDQAAAVRRAEDALAAGLAGGTSNRGRWAGMTVDQVDWTQPGIAPHQERIRRYLATLPERVQRGQGLTLVGDVGTGKSLTAGLIVASCSRANVPAVLLTAPEICARVLDGRPEDRVEQRARLKRVPLLVLDDLGTEAPTARNAETLFDLVDAREANKRATIVTTNLSSQQLVERYQGLHDVRRVLDRLAAVNHVLTYRGPSYRRQQLEDW